MPKARAILLAAGDMSRWNNYLGVRKHLIPIHGEPLIHRTQRMLAERGVRDIRVVCQEDRASEYVLEGVGVHAEPAWAMRDWSQEHETSRHLWNLDGRTLLLYGDVYFTPALLDAMVNDPGDPWRVYGRHGGSEHTGKDHGEMFGWVFAPEHHARLDAAREVAIAYTVGELWWRCIGWEVYRIATAELPWHHSREPVHFAEWDDQSDDFDGPGCWLAWSRINGELWR